MFGRHSSEKWVSKNFVWLWTSTVSTNPEVMHSTFVIIYLYNPNIYRYYNKYRFFGV